MRRFVIGTIVAIFGIGAALGVGYPAGAKSATGHHAWCANAARSTAKQAKPSSQVQKAQEDRACSDPRRSEGRPPRASDEAAHRTALPLRPCPRQPGPSPRTTPPTAIDANSDDTNEDYSNGDNSRATWSGPSGHTRSPVGHTRHSCMGHSTRTGTDIRATPRLGPPCNPCAGVEDEVRIKLTGPIHPHPSSSPAGGRGARGSWCG